MLPVSKSPASWAISVRARTAALAGDAAVPAVNTISERAGKLPVVGQSPYGGDGHAQAEILEPELNAVLGKSRSQAGQDRVGQVFERNGG